MGIEVEPWTSSRVSGSIYKQRGGLPVQTPAISSDANATVANWCASPVEDWVSLELSPISLALLFDEDEDEIGIM
ncbi:MAG TPA: hypothetical protein VEG32_07115 [Clostridia bacterium]|nr:hypothetical protein [Clostridia bacterium]